MTPSPARVLVVEDDPAVRRGVADALGLAGYEALEALDGAHGLDRALATDPDLVLLDVMLPELDGFEVLTRLRRQRPGLPVILLTARGAEQDRVKGLRSGADDYVVKPFSVAELLARVEAVLRRSAERSTTTHRRVAVGGRTFDLDRHEVTLADGRRVGLTERESALVAFLVANPERTISREELLRYVWHVNPKGLETRTVDMLVARLRERLEERPEEPAVIATVRGKGYKLAAVPEPAD